FKGTSISGRSGLRHPRARTRASFWRGLVLPVLILILSSSPCLAARSLSTTTAVSENFDGMGSSAIASLPTDFRVDKQTTVRTLGSFTAAATATERAGGASLSTSAANGIYNFGAPASTSTDRAVGFLSSS